MVEVGVGVGVEDGGGVYPGGTKVTVWVTAGGAAASAAKATGARAVAKRAKALMKCMLNKFGVDGARVGLFGSVRYGVVGDIEDRSTE